MIFQKDRTIPTLSLLTILYLGPIAAIIFSSEYDYALIWDYFTFKWIFFVITIINFLILSIPALKFLPQFSSRFIRISGRVIVSLLLGSLFTRAFPIYAINYKLLFSSIEINKVIPESAKISKRQTESCLFVNEESHEIFLLNYENPKECEIGLYEGKSFTFMKNTFYIFEKKSKSLH